MVISTQELMNKYGDYKVPKMKIKREIEKGNYFLIKKGLYETEKAVPGYRLSQYIKSPSYLSFEYALSIYGLIPEFAVEFTNATTGQKHITKYTNQFGRYSYRDVPSSVFYLETKWIQESGYSYLIATKEKAICDYLYILSPIHSKKKIQSLLNERIKKDRTKTQIEGFTKLDLMEMTRKHICSHKE